MFDHTLSSELSGSVTGEPESPTTLPLRVLTRAIEADPDAPVYYLLRAEEWLTCGQVEQAQADFLTAREQAEKLLVDAAWGFIYQAYMDRAEAGLRQCARSKTRSIQHEALMR